MIKLLVQKSNLSLQQNKRILLTNAEVMKAFIDFIYIMALNQLPDIPIYWDCGQFIGNIGIQNISLRTRYQVLQNLHFAANTKKDKTDKDFKIWPTIDPINESLQAVYSNEPEKSIDKPMKKFKGLFSMRQYLKMKPLKWALKWRFG